MKLVFICNEAYKDKISLSASGKGFDFCGVHFEFEKEQQGNLQENCETNVKFLTSSEDFDSDEIDRFFLDGDFCQNQVFVMPELLWKDRSVDEGYEMALQLLKKHNRKKSKKAKVFVLHFISNFTQEQLLRVANKRYHSLVKTFPHSCITDVENGKHWCRELHTLKPKYYSETHFHLIRNIAISEWGRLETIDHQLKPKDLARSAEMREHFIKLLDELDDDAYPLEGLGERIAQLTKAVNDDCPPENASDEEKDSYANEIVSDIQSLIAAIRKSLPSDENQHQENTKSSYNVLVIDDDDTERKELCRFFEEYYKYVASNNDGTTFDIADADDAKDWMEKNAKDYHIIILDLLFMDKANKFWWPYNGLDLLKIIPPYCTVRVITRLPRERVGTITKAANITLDAGQILTKSKGWKQLEGCLYDRLDEINKECERKEPLRRKIEDVFMPTKGSFYSAGIVRAYYQSLIDLGFFKDTFAKAVDRAKKSREDPINTLPAPLKGHTSPVTDGENGNIASLFDNYLAHRLSFLWWAAENGVFHDIDINQVNEGYTTKLKAPERGTKLIKITKGYLNEIGFSVPKNPNNNKLIVNLNVEEMFPEEWEFYREQLNANAIAIDKDNPIYRWYFLIASVFCDKPIQTIHLPEQGTLSISSLNNFFEQCFNRFGLSDGEKIQSKIKAITDVKTLEKLSIDIDKLKEALTKLNDFNKSKINEISKDFITIQQEVEQH